MTTLDFQCHLEENGWARCVFTSGSSRCELPFEFTEDPVTKIARVAVAIAAGAGVPPIDVTFPDGPGGAVARFVHRDPTTFELRRIGSSQPGTTDPDEPIFAAQIESLPFAIAVGRSLDALLRTHGLLGYTRKWARYCFPLHEYVLLRLLLDHSPAAEQWWNERAPSTLAAEADLFKSTPEWQPVRRHPAAELASGLVLPL